MRMVIKSFKEVRVGEWGEDYSGERRRVLGKGTGRKGWEELKKWDSLGAMDDFVSNLELYGYTEEDLKNQEMVAVRDEDGDTFVYNYGEDGFCVMEIVYEKNLRKVMK